LRLADGRPILDLYGRGFVLLRLGTHAPEGSALEAAAAVRRVPLATVALAEPEAARLYEYPLVLVRPDGHVAWRGDKVPADAAAVIDHVRGAGAPPPAPTPARPAESGPHRAATR
jgi:hypothetical protein